MYFKTFNKLEKNEKIEILSELGLYYDLQTEKEEEYYKSLLKELRKEKRELMNKFRSW